jgi:hypothetical protein
MQQWDLCVVCGMFTGENLSLQGKISANPFTIDIKTIRRRIRAIGINKSVGPGNIPGEIIKLGGET